MSRRQTILIIDDQRELADVVQQSLEAEGYDVMKAVDGAAGLEIATRHRPDLVLLDLTLPDIDGLQVCETIRRDPKAGRVPIIVLSARASETDRVLGLDSGADDYLIKPFGGRELLARVRAALRRSKAAASRRNIRCGALEIDLIHHRVLYEKKPVELRLAEYRVLEFLASEPGRAFTRDEIIDAALHRDSSVTERTIDVHITRIRHSLGRGADLIETIKGVGYRLRESA
jgi:two-component system phosphate regulon response regulator PhoB